VCVWVCVCVCVCVCVRGDATCRWLPFEYFVLCFPQVKSSYRKACLSVHPDKVCDIHCNNIHDSNLGTRLDHALHNVCIQTTV